MLKRRSRKLHWVAAVVIGLSLSSAFSQSEEKPKLKDFGSSLDRLKWDPARNEATTQPAEGERKSDDLDVVRIETNLVVADVLVLDQRGQPVRELTANDFIVTEDNIPQKIGMLLLGDNVSVPRSIVLIIDYSPSQLPFLAESIQAAKTLVDKLAPLDRMAIVTDDVELLADFTKDKEKLKSSLDSLRNRTTFDLNLGATVTRQKLGLSAQYSALMATLKELFSGEDERPIIIFQTDGDEARLLRDPIVTPAVPPHLPSDLDKAARRAIEASLKFLEANRREFSIKDIYKAVEESRTTIYTVVPGFRLMGLSADTQLNQLRAEHESRTLAVSFGQSVQTARQLTKFENDRWKRTPIEAHRFEIEQESKTQEALSMVSTLTGGWTAFLENSSQADEIYSRIFSDINRRYLVGYYPTNKEHDGKRRKISITVRDHPDYIVMGRKAYYAPGPEQ